ncbi:hypothetical protein [Halovivax gelatinilyticus]|uniref:hypothetical protein n=1 Tax=Halovivax gelatinilyticus TaxID=2961597 RepID=UPI0020CA74B0|nr:hypothetical protein [Halovivax gelatinilyticus]
MSQLGRPTESTTAAIESAGFVKLLVRPDGDALAAAGVLARALEARGTPFQVSVGSRPDRTARVTSPEDDSATLALGPLGDVESTSDDPIYALDPTDGPLGLQAADLVRDLGDEPDDVLALAGAIAAGVDPTSGPAAQSREIAIEAGRLEPNPGVAVPTSDSMDGLVHSTLVRAPWSGDRDAVDEALGDADDDRTLASLVAIDAVGHETATQRAAETIGRVVHPDETPTGPFETLGGTADVLSATARTARGIGIALAIGHAVFDAAVEAWRDHGLAVHDALDTASTARHDGAFVLKLHADTPVLAQRRAIESVAELAAATITPEPVVCVVGDDRVAVATTDEEPVGPLCRSIADDHQWDAGTNVGTIEGDGIDVDVLVERVRGSR